MASAVQATPRCFRAPLGTQDLLCQEQVDRYISLLSAGIAEVVGSPAFEQEAQRTFGAAGCETLEGNALCTAVLGTLQSMEQLQSALASEFADGTAVSHVLSAFAPCVNGVGGGVSAAHFPAFVRFCLAYRVHCYFETSRLAAPEMAAPAVALSLGGRPQVVFVLGGPGAGKGTQCSRISETYGYVHLSAGDLLREERKRQGSEFGELIESYIKAGKLVPVEITVKLIKQAMELHGWAQGKYLVDGFPRSFDNMQGWQRVLGDKAHVKFTLFFDCSQACMEARLLERGKTSGRSDDNVESMRKRFETFKQESMPVVEWLESTGSLRRLSAERSVEEVWGSVQATFGPTVVFVLGGPGSGKGTICTRIASAFGYTHLSAGDLLRAERKRPGSELGELIEGHIRDGKLVPAEVTVRLLMQAMEQRGWEGGKYLVDGFPRSFDNLQSWHATVKGQVSLKCCLYLECSEGVMEARLLERGKSSGRSDDNLESIRKRFITFHSDSLPVVERFGSEGLLRRINAEQSVEDVWRDVQALFGPSVVFVLGGPGSGKGTQCARITATCGYTHLSAGDLLRAERKRPGSEFGELIEGYIREGKLVPVEITIKLIIKAMEQAGWEGGKYLIDGFPRSLENLEGWNKIVGSRALVRFSLFLDCGEAVMESRLLERGKTSGRSDDNVESIRKRFITFREESMPVLNVFRQRGILRRIDAEQTCEDVWAEVRKLFAPSVVFILGGPGAGKGTQCSRISPSFGFHHLSAGDLLREERKRPGSELGELIENHIKNGMLVPVEIVVRLLQQAMERCGWDGGKFLIDGFPRSFDNLEGWNKVIGDKVNVRFVLFLECSESVMQERLVERGKTSGRADDNPDTIKKRFQTFLSESVPVANKFLHDGLLRRINAEQDPDEVWSCVQELMHNELDPHFKNRAIILVKPHAHNKETLRFVQSYLTAHNIAVINKGSVSGQRCAEMDLFRRQYCHIIRHAEAVPGSLNLPSSAAMRFKDKFCLDWSVALSKQDVVGALQAPARLGFSDYRELSEAWDVASVLKLTPHLQVGRVAGKCGASCFVVNGFVPHWLETLSNHAGMSFFLVEFDPAELSWERFRSHIIGATNPLKAPPESIRAQLHQNWSDMGLSEPPSTLNNCVHASAGPLEALRERMLWADAELENDPLARLVLSGGVPIATLQEWLDNPYVDDWCVSGQMRSGPIFQCTVDCDSTAFRDAAVGFVKGQSSSGGLQAWSMRATEACGRGAVLRSTTPTPSLLRPQRMTILHFNDVYNVEPRAKEPVGGLARFVTRVQELKAESVARGEEEALVLFSGDAFNPSLTSTTTMGKHMVPALNYVGINTACYGNHDFDFGVDNLVDLASQNNFPWLISNVTEKASGRPLANGLPTRLLDYHGRKIGLLGLVEREWLVTLATLSPEDVEYEDFCPCARRLAKHLREQQGAEIVIALTHMRVPNDELLAHEVPELDLILGGHDHHYDVKPVGPHGTYVLKSGTDFRDITVLELEFTDQPGPRPFRVAKTRHEEIVSSIAEHAEAKVLVDECVAKLGASMDKVIGYSAVDLDSRFSEIRTRETNVGNLVADIMRRGLSADIAMINSGTIRADAIIEKGVIKMRDLVNMLPMLDELCLLEMTGRQILLALENSVSQYPRLEGRFAQVSGVVFTFDAAQTPGKRLVGGSAKVNGAPLDMDRKYKLCTKDYLRQGKDGFDVFREGACLADGEQAGILPTMVREYFQSLSTLNGDSDSAPQASTQRAAEVLVNTGLARVGNGPDPLQRFAIEPKVEARIVCLNPVVT